MSIKDHVLALSLLAAACTTNGGLPGSGEPDGTTTSGTTTSGTTTSGTTTSGTTTSGATGGTAGQRALNANVTTGTTVTSAYGGTCSMLIRDTSSCEAARAALGLSGNWLKFSCNVELGLIDASGNATTTYANANSVNITFHDLPDSTSNYYPTSGSYSFTANNETVAGTYEALHVAYTTTFPDPSSIAQQSVSMNVPLNPIQATGTQSMSLGMVGVAINGVAIYDNLANATDNIFAEAGSFDTCQGHPSPGNGGTYHYHGEPYTISYNDNALIGVLRDGFFVYGRKDADGSTPGSTANLESAGSSSTLYKFGGHAGPDPITGNGNTFHYHLTEWEGCYHESGSNKSSDDGETQDTLNNPAGSCGGTWVDAWFLTGHGNGGVFDKVPSGLSGQAPSQTLAGARYYYGTPGTCTGC